MTPLRQNDRNYRLYAGLFFIAGVALRVGLWWANPPDNHFDDHFEPIFLIMANGSIPPKNACWECFQPPVFYWTSAQLANLFFIRGMGFIPLLKLLQFLPCLYGILTVALTYLILGKVPLSPMARLTAFGMVCLLPRHIYMSAVHSNDTLSYLLTAASLYVLLLVIGRKWSFPLTLLLGIVTTVSLFTKYTSLIILPATAFALFFSNSKRLLSGKHTLISASLTLLMPIAFLAADSAVNLRQYGTAMPWNIHLLNVEAGARDAAPVDFMSFKPWESINPPILVPGKMHSFWTVVYSGMWFDTEPKFIYLADTNLSWWNHYVAWLRGEAAFPAQEIPLSAFTLLMGNCLIILGLVPTLLTVTGFCVQLRAFLKKENNLLLPDKTKIIVLFLLVAGNAAGMVFHALQFPEFAAMKASYFLNSMPAFAAFLGFGIKPFESNALILRIIFILLGGLFSLAAAHVAHIILTKL